MKTANQLSKHQDSLKCATTINNSAQTIMKEHKKRRRLVISISLVLPTLILLYHYLPLLVNYMTFDLFELNSESHLGKAINFFFYDTVKILILLFLISSLMGVINAYFPVDRLRIYLTTKKMYGLEYFLASFFGAITPFCSCSSIPLFIGFVKGGIPLGVTFAYLITSPLVNEVAVAMFIGLFGLKATLIYSVSGILLGMVGGFILGKLKLDKYLSDWVREVQKNAIQINEEWTDEKTPFIDRLPSIIREGWDIVKKVLLYVIIGIAIGAAMHGYVPENFFTEFLSADKWYAVPLAVILAVPCMPTQQVSSQLSRFLWQKGFLWARLLLL
ncbi:putative permease [Saccharicrinis fermentans DSM 9555 = JCM 21142]|uniref:Putative permease n=1 Tax=Saccharicrinis fermentans DSM 9555 = JCM 21142 TaxID=869213 RepID=W7XVQ0_9BACT|nr:permease [Saccharicrinis fermentans]GAF02255.1 putative permease [Saccharicrinis fermentans DSM 9555 = JCM 21142]